MLCPETGKSIKYCSTIFCCFRAKHILEHTYQFLIGFPYLSNYMFSMITGTGSPYFQILVPNTNQDAELDGGCDTLSMEITHSPQVPGSASKTHCLGSSFSIFFSSRICSSGHYQTVQSLDALIHIILSSVLFLTTSSLAFSFPSSETFTLQFITNTNPFSLPGWSG